MTNCPLLLFLLGKIVCNEEDWIIDRIINTYAHNIPTRTVITVKLPDCKEGIERLNKHPNLLVEQDKAGVITIERIDPERKE